MRILQKRIISTVLDYFVFFSLLYFYIDSFGIEQKDGTRVVSGLTTLPLFLFWFLYFVVMERVFGGTVSHLAFGLRVVSIDGKKASFLQILKRRILDPLDFFLFGLPAFIVAKYSPLSQRIGDMWAKTVVAMRVGQ
jgi:uncharacterized RDD family membrane protein YckC